MSLRELYAVDIDRFSVVQWVDELLTCDEWDSGNLSGSTSQAGSYILRFLLVALFRVVSKVCWLRGNALLEALLYPLLREKMSSRREDPLVNIALSHWAISRS